MVGLDPVHGCVDGSVLGPGAGWVEPWRRYATGLGRQCMDRVDGHGNGGVNMSKVTGRSRVMSSQGQGRREDAALAMAIAAAPASRAAPPPPPSSCDLT